MLVSLGLRAFPLKVHNLFETCLKAPGQPFLNPFLVHIKAKKCSVRTLVGASGRLGEGAGDLAPARPSRHEKCPHIVFLSLSPAEAMQSEHANKSTANQVAPSMKCHTHDLRRAVNDSLDGVFSVIGLIG